MKLNTTLDSTSPKVTRSCASNFIRGEKWASSPVCIKLAPHKITPFAVAVVRLITLFASANLQSATEEGSPGRNGASAEIGIGGHTRRRRGVLDWRLRSAIAAELDLDFSPFRAAAPSIPQPAFLLPLPFFLSRCSFGSPAEAFGATRPKIKSA